MIQRQKSYSYSTYDMQDSTQRANGALWSVTKESSAQKNTTEINTRYIFINCSINGIKIYSVGGATRKLHTRIKERIHRDTSNKETPQEVQDTEFQIPSVQPDAFSESWVALLIQKLILLFNNMEKLREEN